MHTKHTHLRSCSVRPKVVCFNAHAKISTHTYTVNPENYDNFYCCIQRWRQRQRRCKAITCFVVHHAYNIHLLSIKVRAKVKNSTIMITSIESWWLVRFHAAAHRNRCKSVAVASPKIYLQGQSYKLDLCLKQFCWFTRISVFLPAFSCTDPTIWL